MLCSSSHASLISIFPDPFFTLNKFTSFNSIVYIFISYIASLIKIIQKGEVIFRF